MSSGTLCNVILVGPPIVILVHCIGDVVLLHGLLLGNTHPPPCRASTLCTHDIGLSSKFENRKYDPLGHKLTLLTI